uniref:Uncharacterized protein n=1 Tax=Arundo donax TaxID=35708 RepID=A0A0A9AIX9_ARUDO
MSDLKEQGAMIIDLLITYRITMCRFVSSLAVLPAQRLVLQL